MMESVYAKIDQAFLEYVYYCEGVMRDNAPAKTGRLKASIHATRESETSYLVGTTIEYAAANNNGRRAVKPVNKKALWWPELGWGNAVKSAGPYEGSHFLEKTLSQLGG